MSNPSKEKGTRFESELRSYLRARLADDRIDRRALHGTCDMGDLYGLRAHGWEGIVEAKAHKTFSRSYVREWRDQTLAERDNAGAGFALLVVKRPNRPVGEAEVHVTLKDLCHIAGGIHHEYDEDRDGGGDGAWVRMSLSECCDLMEG